MGTMNGITSEELLALEKSGKYLFHVTNEDGLRGILTTGKILPLTHDGMRELYKLTSTEKRLTSFTESPSAMLNDGNALWFSELNKDIVLVLGRQNLVEQGVFKVEYVSEAILKRNWEDYKYAVEEHEDEHEWRSLDSVDIAGSLKAAYILNIR